MFGDIALQLLQLAGHSGTVPSAILAADLPDAIRRLEQGLGTVVEPVRPDAAARTYSYFAASTRAAALALGNLRHSFGQPDLDQRLVRHIAPVGLDAQRV